MLPDQISKPLSPQEEFRQRMKHDFMRYIYLGLKSGNWEQDHILSEIYTRPGYQAHKIIYHNSLWSHIYIRFDDRNHAREAVNYFKKLSRDLTAEVEQLLLSSWFCYETLSKCVPSWTLAFVDTEGKQPLFVKDPEPIFTNKLKEFGEPQVIYSGAIKDRSVALVLFTSMAEALGAAIANGEWQKRKKEIKIQNKEVNNLYYRVKIIGKEKEASLIKRFINSDNSAVEAFKLDYFINPDDEEWGNTLINELAIHTDAAVQENQNGLQLRENFDYQMSTVYMNGYYGNGVHMDGGLDIGYSNGFNGTFAIENGQLNNGYPSPGYGSGNYYVYNTHLQGNGHMNGFYENRNGFTNVQRRGNRKPPRGQRGRYQKRVSPRGDQRADVSNMRPPETYRAYGWITENTLNAAEFHPRGNFSSNCEVSESTVPQFNATNVETAASQSPTESIKRKDSLGSSKESLVANEHCEPVAQTHSAADVAQPVVAADDPPPPVLAAPKGRQYQRGNKRNKRR